MPSQSPDVCAIENVCFFLNYESFRGTLVTLGNGRQYFKDIYFPSMYIGFLTYSKIVVLRLEINVLKLI